MINAAIVGASLGSAMKYAAPAVEKLGFDTREFMREVMEQLGGQGIPGADNLMAALPFASASRDESLTPNGATGVTGGHSLA